MTKKDEHDLPTSDKKSGPGNTPGKPDPDAKNKPELAGVGEKPGEKKNTPPPSEQPHGENTIHNRDQDPKHPANITPPYRGDATPRPVAEGVTVPPEEMLTEQEKEAVGSGLSGDVTAGVGPSGPALHTTGPVETIEDQGIGPRTPYPTGEPPVAREETTLSQGIKRGDEDFHARKAPRPGETFDTRPQERIGGPQETTHPPKRSGL